MAWECVENLPGIILTVILVISVVVFFAYS